MQPSRQTHGTFRCTHIRHPPPPGGGGDTLGGAASVPIHECKPHKASYARTHIYLSYTWALRCSRLSVQKMSASACHALRVMLGTLSHGSW
jgi:hypothetical protein